MLTTFKTKFLDSIHQLPIQLATLICFTSSIHCLKKLSKNNQNQCNFPRPQSSTGFKVVNATILQVGHVFFHLPSLQRKAPNPNATLVVTHLHQWLLHQAIQNTINRLILQHWWNQNH